MPPVSRCGWRSPARVAGTRLVPEMALRCLDLTTVNTAVGTVEKVSMGIGIQMPSLVVKTSLAHWCR